MIPSLYVFFYDPSFFFFFAFYFTGKKGGDRANFSFVREIIIV